MRQDAVEQETVKEFEQRVIAVEETAEQDHQRVSEVEERQKADAETVAALKEHVGAVVSTAHEDHERVSEIEQKQTAMDENVAGLEELFTGQIAEHTAQLAEIQDELAEHQEQLAATKEVCSGLQESLQMDVIDTMNQLAEGAATKDDLLALQEAFDNASYVDQESLTKQLEDFQTAGQEQVIGLLQTVTEASASKDEMEAADAKISDIAATLQRHEASLEESQQLVPKVRAVDTRIDELDRKIQEDAAMHQRKFDAQTAATKELVNRKRRESKERLDRRNSERRQSEAEDRRNADLFDG